MADSIRFLRHWNLKCLASFTNQGMVHALWLYISSAMQLALNGSVGEDSSETQPILSESLIAEDSQETTLCEIRTVDGEISAVTDVGSDGSYSLVNSEQPQCRICLDNEGLLPSVHCLDAMIPGLTSCYLVPGEDLIAPCHCKGTQKYVHRSCLDHWRSTKEGFAFAHCTECRARFLLRPNVPSDRWWLRLKFQFLVARDHAFIFIVVQLIVAMLGVLVYRIYGEQLREMFGYREHPYAFYIMAVMAIILVGLLYGFFIAIICGQRISERHYHVLAKQELTKEYIVEDRESREIPELDPSQESELRMLGLY
ncbi:E3 ubiquitin-protein ligase MARCH8 [Bienertia sinuspersici]